MRRFSHIARFVLIATGGLGAVGCSTEHEPLPTASPAQVEPAAATTPFVQVLKPNALETDADIVARSEAERKGWRGTGKSGHDPELVKNGLQIAQRECAACHAVDATSKSPHTGAPPLRTVLDRFDDQDELSARLINGMHVGGDEMPNFDFNTYAADALMAYLGTIASPEVE